MVALAVGEAKEALFGDGVAAVPQRQRKTELLFVVRESRQAIFAPAVGARTRLVMREVVPGVAVVAVVFAYGAPLPLAQVRAPFLPGNSLFAGVIQALLFGDFDVV